MRFLSWAVLSVCFAVVYFIGELCVRLVFWALGEISVLSATMRIILYLLAGGTLLTIVIAPIIYGTSATYFASEAVKPSRKGTRYKVFSVFVMILSAASFLLSLSYRSINIACIYTAVFSMALLIMSNNLEKEKLQ